MINGCAVWVADAHAWCVLDGQAELMEEGDNSEYVFSVHNRGVESIGGLEKYKKLRSLDLSFNKIKVVEGLSQAIELRELKIYGNELESLCNLEQYVTRSHWHLRCFGKPNVQPDVLTPYDVAAIGRLKWCTLTAIA